jgi:ATP/maltotriose-dependent transcriptional regulator MalT
MTDDQGHTDKDQSADDSPGWHEPQPRLLARLIELEFAYDRERAKLSRSPDDDAPKAQLLEKLRSQHQERRAPYLQKLAERNRDIRPQPRSRPIAASVQISAAPEVSILRSVMAGMQNSQIATELGLTETAVKDHIKSILNKLVSVAPHRKLAHQADEAHRPECS